MLPALASALATRSATDTTPDADNGFSATANCHQDEHVVSGGFRLPGEGQVTVSRAKEERRWKVIADGEGPLTVFAYCGGKGTTHHSAKLTVPGKVGVSESLAARCDSDETLVSGGYETVDAQPGEHDLVPFKSRRSGDRRWKVTVFNDADVPTKLKVFAYCQRNVEVKVRSTQSAPITTETFGSATAECNQGEELLSGGYTTTPKSDFSNETGPDHFYTRSFRSAKRSWTVRAHNYSDVAGRITTFAYCKA
jgi:hypothetical protein